MLGYLDLPKLIRTARRLETTEFMLTATVGPSVTAEERRDLIRIFSKWQPPQGVTMKFLYLATDERHSFGLFDVDSAAAIAEIPYTFGDWIEFQAYVGYEAIQPAEGKR